MKPRTKLLLYALALASLAWVGIALAQSLPPGVDPLVPATWFLSAAGYGALVLLAVNFLKANVLNVTGWGTIALSAGLSFGGPLLASTGVLSAFGVALDGSLPELISFGLTAFIASSGAWDSFARLKAQPGGVTAVVDVSHAPTAVDTAQKTVAKEARNKK